MLRILGFWRMLLYVWLEVEGQPLLPAGAVGLGVATVFVGEGIGVDVGLETVLLIAGDIIGFIFKVTVCTGIVGLMVKVAAGGVILIVGVGVGFFVKSFLIKRVFTFGVLPKKILLVMVTTRTKANSIDTIILVVILDFM